MDGKLQSTRRGLKRASHVTGNNVLTLVQQCERSSQAGGAEKFSDTEKKCVPSERRGKGGGKKRKVV